MSSPICWTKNNIFQIHHNRQAKNAKTGDLFSRNRKIRQNKKNKCKTCQKKRQQGFFGEKRKTEKESLTKVYKDSKNCEERKKIVETKRQSKSKKNKKMKWRKNKTKNGETRKKRTSG